MDKLPLSSLNQLIRIPTPAIDGVSFIPSPSSYMILETRNGFYNIIAPNEERDIAKDIANNFYDTRTINIVLVRYSSSSISQLEASLSYAKTISSYIDAYRECTLLCLGYTALEHHSDEELHELFGSTFVDEYGTEFKVSLVYSDISNFAIRQDVPYELMKISSRGNIEYNGQPYQYIEDFHKCIYDINMANYIEYALQIETSNETNEESFSPSRRYNMNVEKLDELIRLVNLASYGRTSFDTDEARRELAEKKLAELRSNIFKDTDKWALNNVTYPSLSKYHHSPAADIDWNMIECLGRIWRQYCREGIFGRFSLQDLAGEQSQKFIEQAEEMSLDIFVHSLFDGVHIDDILA